MSDLPFVDNFLTPEMLSDPMPFLARARKDSPIFKTKDNQGREIYVVTTYELVKEAYKLPNKLSNKFSHLIWAGSSNAEAEAILDKAGFEYERYGSLIFNSDDPEHFRFKKLLLPIFTPAQVHKLEAAFKREANELIDTFIDKGEFDLAQDFAVPFSLKAIFTIIGLEVDIPRAFRWSEAAKIRIAKVGTPEEEVAAAHELVEFLTYLQDVVKRLRTTPDNSLVSATMQTRAEGAEPLTDDEVMALMHELIFAGNESTRNTMIATLALLLTHPEQMAALANDRSLMAGAIEESLRYHSTATSMWRLVKQDTELGGVILPAGSLLLLRQDSANHDEKQFADADTYNIFRKNSKAHLSFGFGIHQCLGQHLARKEIEVAIGCLLDRLPNMRLLESKSDLGREPNLIIHILNKIQVQFDPRVKLSA